MTISSAYEVHCALTVLGLIDATGSKLTDLEYSYGRVASNGYFRIEELKNGQALLESLGLLVQVGDLIRRSSTADLLFKNQDAFVSEVIESLRNRRNAQSPSLLSLEVSPAVPHQLVPGDSVLDQLSRQLIGSIGELHVIHFTIQTLEYLGQLEELVSIKQVSLISDRFGFDIAVELKSRVFNLEVKTSTIARSSTFEFYLSRNEYEISQVDPNWFLVVCYLRQRNPDIVDVEGWISGIQIKDCCPLDRPKSIWQSARISLPKDCLKSDLGDLFKS